MKWSVSLVPYKDLNLAWPVLSEILAPAVAYSHGRYETSDLRQAVRLKHMSLWVVSDDDSVICGAFTTRVSKYPRKRFVSVDFLAGTDFKNWAPIANQTLKSYAKECGLDGVELLGRRGMLKVLKPLGWKNEAMWLETTGT